MDYFMELLWLLSQDNILSIGKNKTTSTYQTVVFTFFELKISTICEDIGVPAQ